MQLGTINYPLTLLKTFYFFFFAAAAALTLFLALYYEHLGLNGVHYSTSARSHVLGAMGGRGCLRQQDRSGRDGGYRAGRLFQCVDGAGGSGGAFWGGWLYESVGPFLMYRWVGLGILGVLLLLVVVGKYVVKLDSVAAAS